MGIKFLFIYLIAIAVGSCTPCEDDPYGEEVIFVVPVTTSPSRDSIALGDTLWIYVYIDKEVKISSSDNTIRLDSFNFLTELFVSEISGVEEDYYSPVDTIVKNGKLDYLPLPTALAYPISYEEHPDYYLFNAGIVLKEKGIYWIGMSTHILVLEAYEHPAMYICETNRRDDVRIHYSNSSTNQKNFESIFKQTQVSYLQNVDYEDFASVGSVAVVVY